MDNYPATRESRRLTGSIIGVAVVLVVGVPAAIGTRGIAELAIILLAVLGVVAFAVGLIPATEPRSLTPLSLGARSGTWRASSPSFQLPGLAERFPRVTARAELPGVVTASEAGIRWDPTPQTAGTYGVEPLVFDPSWTATARRLRGFRAPAQLTLTNPADSTEVTLWLRRAKSFLIP